MVQSSTRPTHERSARPHALTLAPVRTANMNLYKSIFHKLVEPLNAFEAQEILDAGKQLTGCDCENCKMNNAIGETVLRIGRLRKFAEFILSDDFEERAAQLLREADNGQVPLNQPDTDVEKN